MIAFGPIALLRPPHVMTNALTFFTVVGENVRTILAALSVLVELEMPKLSTFGIVLCKKDVLLIPLSI
jgi:hypothetical protein